MFNLIIGVAVIVMIVVAPTTYIMIKELLNEKEKWYISEFDAFPNGYNKTEGGEKGYVVTDEIKQKIAASLQGNTHSDDTKKKMSEDRKGEKCHWFGKQRSEETKAKISQSLKGRKKPPEARQKMRGRKGYWNGKSHSQETREKISQTLKDYEFTEDHKKNLSEAHRKAWAEGKRRKKE